MRHRMLLLVSAATFLVAGCGTDTVTTPAGPEGTYALETVNGVTLPFLKEETASERTEVVSGTLTLRSDKSYLGEIFERRLVGGSAEYLRKSSSGTFSVADDRLTFSESASGAKYYGTLSGTRLAATMGDVTFGFVRN